MCAFCSPFLCFFYSKIPKGPQSQRVRVQWIDFFHSSEHCMASGGQNPGRGWASEVHPGQNEDFFLLCSLCVHYVFFLCLFVFLLNYVWIGLGFLAFIVVSFVWLFGSDSEQPNSNPIDWLDPLSHHFLFSSSTPRQSSLRAWQFASGGCQNGGPSQGRGTLALSVFSIDSRSLFSQSPSSQHLC